MRIFSTCFMLLISAIGHGQIAQPRFGNPLDIPLRLSGNYGELRNNHFHAGLDIKTDGVTGLPVRASQSGFVARIKVSYYGYGNALYIEHPNGYTTVYGHLHSYAQRIDSLVKDAQYAQESFEIELYPARDVLPVDSGEIIAYSGNSGGSGGPHLHFEIRETASEIPRNPLLYESFVEDSRMPEIREVAIYPIPNRQHGFDHNAVKRYTTVPNGRNLTLGSIAIPVNGAFGIGVASFDQQNGSTNRNGVFELMLEIDGKQYAHFRADSISFDASRYINAQIDYEHYNRVKRRNILLFRLPGNALKTVSFPINHGVIDLAEGTYQAKITALDVAGNTKVVNFELKAKSPSSSEERAEQNLVAWNAAYSYEDDQLKVFMAPATLYFSQVIDINNSPQKTSTESSIFQIGTEHSAAHLPISIDINTSSIEDRAGLFIAQVDAFGNFKRPLSTTLAKDWAQAESKYFGYFSLKRDVTAPQITPIDIGRKGGLVFTVRDDMSGVEEIDAFIDGQWILSEYDPKRKRLTIEQTELDACPDLRNLHIQASDALGNMATFETTLR